MKIKTLITTILLGTSTMAAVASAHPAQSIYGEQSYASSSSARDHRTPRRRFTHAPSNVGWRYISYADQPDVAPVPRAIPLADPMPIVGNEQRIALIGKRADAIRLQMLRGDVFVTEIVVELSNGQILVQPINRTLSARGSDAPVIDLAGPRDLRRVVVVTSGGMGAEYQLFAC